MPANELPLCFGSVGARPPSERPFEVVRYNGATVRTRSLTLAVLVALSIASLGFAACGGGAPSPGPTQSAPGSSSPPSPLPSVSGKVFNVTAYGAVGNGTSNASAAVQRALGDAAKVGGTVYLPAGTYACPTPITLPNGVGVRGDGASSWLEGQLVFASADRIQGLKIGAAGAGAVTNAADAAGTTFSDCRLHGGGSEQGVDGSVLYLGGGQGSVHDVTFTHCQIERTSYVPPAGVDAYARGVGNTITIHEFCYLPHSGHVEHITFTDCDLGASNGTASGALRMVLEAFTWDNHTGLVYHGWKDLTFTGCTIEAGDTTGLDFADQLVPSTGRHSSSGVLISGCTFLGAHRNPASSYTGLPIVYECPTGIVISHNTFYASPHEAIGGSHVGQGVTGAPGLLIEGNTFDMTRSPIGLKHLTGEPCLSLIGFNNRVIGNTFVYDQGLGVLIEGDASPAVGSTIQGNTFTDTRAANGEPTIELTDQQGQGCHDNHIIGNTITNRAAGGAGVIAQTGGGPNFAQGNTIYCGKAAPFVAQSGKLVHNANSVRP
jgi:Pectate lyase superfamily protein/Right handed beta helix region